MFKNFKKKPCDFMRKGRFFIKQNLKNVDLVYEVLDARAPVSTRNKSILALTKNKLKIVILAKCDLADKDITKAWIKKITENEKVFSIAVNSKDRKKIKNLINISHNLLREREKKLKKKNLLNGKFRAMVVGVPNVGKSTLINSLVGRKKAKTGNFPGVTLSEQWISLDDKINLLDTPGNLTFEEKNEKQELVLQLIGSIKSGEFDEERVAFFLLNFLKENNIQKLNEIFCFKSLDFTQNMLYEYGRVKNMLKKGAEVDLKRAAEFLIKEFKEKKLGLISLEKP